MPSQYTVINASAGSGKTYTLVQRVLMICLRQPAQPEIIRHILALTFTNKAANEMKERILEALKAYSSADYEENSDLQVIQKKLSAEGTSVSLKTLNRRAKDTLDYVLHHYSHLNIGTIDKFNARLVRSFAYELGIPQNFSLEIQSEPYLMEAVDQLLDKIGVDHSISDALLDFVNYNLDNEQRVSINHALYKSAKEFVQDKHYFNLSANKNLDWDVYQKKKDQLRSELNNLKNDNLNLVLKAKDLLAEKGLEIADFSGGSTSGIAAFFIKVDKFYQKERDKFPFPTKEESAMATFLKGPSGTAKHKSEDIFEIVDYLIKIRQNIIKNHVECQKKEKFLAALLPLKVNKEIQDQLLSIEEENDLVLMSKFNVLIHENLKNEPSSFIYEKVGTRFSHYFFDEFQDTSALQWQNFIPLRDHTISSDHTSFTLVGDPKQSIYRFRGGDSTLMLNIINHKEAAPQNALIENLDTNWRSAKNIVSFNNQLYQYLSNLLSEEHRDIFGRGSYQKANANFDGRVKINLVDNSTKDILYEEIALKMQADIQECLNHGFSFSDLSILCRGNFEILTYSRLLGALKVTQNGEDLYIKTISEKGLTLNLSATILAVIEYLRWFLQPKSRQFLVRMMYYLNLSKRINVAEFTSEMLQIIALENKNDIQIFLEDHYGLQLIQKDIPQLNLYNFIEYYVQDFSVEGQETDFVLNFLEMIFNLSQNTNFTLKDFVTYWDEEGQNTSLQASENIDAIQILTVHKAKGLEFPVVLLPMENANKDKKFTGWMLSGEEDLHSVNISSFDPTLEVYDQEMENFNQENIYQNKIDRLCLQYVATTRAVEQMFFYIEKPNKTANHLEIYDFVDDIRNRKFAELVEKPDSFDVNDTTAEQLKKQKPNKNSTAKTMTIDNVAKTTEKTSNIKIATPSRNYTSRSESVKTGIFAHEILAQLTSGKDLERVLSNYLLSGLINYDEKNSISERILGVLNNPEYAPYFAENLEIMNEKDVLISENGIANFYRPDRIVKSDKGLIIIDFKTGKQEEKHQKQVQNYQRILEKLNYVVAKTEIIYV